jgi:hypothetical protein
MLFAASEAEPLECEAPDDVNDDGNPATRLRFSLSSELFARPVR